MSSFVGSDSNTYFEHLHKMKYGVWKQRVEAFLLKALFDFIDGSEILDKYALAGDYKKYYKKQKQALALLKLLISDSQLTHIHGISDPHEAWQKLDTVHEPKGSMNQIFLIQ
ncbi:hypothetical protein RUND412_007843 [Rhizina undulata]